MTVHSRLWMAHGRNWAGTHYKKGARQAEEEPRELDPEEEERRGWQRALIGSAKIMVFLDAMEKGKCTVQRNSVYGSACCLPPIAKSAGWPRMLVAACFRSWLFLMVNFLVQGLVLYYIAQEELIWDGFSGQMFLCNNGLNLDSCPDGPNCVGPARTIFTPSRLYNWNLWALRTFTRDSFLGVFPQNSTEIHDLVDPGEYGVESFSCRLLCCYLFMISLMNDLNAIIDMARLLLLVPNESQPWIALEVPEWAPKEHVMAVHGMSESDFVKLKVAGLPISWKIGYFLFIFVPKCLLWRGTADAGVTFLMETSSMEDMIVNSVALAFILNIDEMIFEELMAQEVRDILEKVQPLEMSNDHHSYEEHLDEEMVTLHDEKYHSRHANYFKMLRDTLPMQLIVSFALTAWFISAYYRRNCIRNERGGLVSHAMRTPLTTTLSSLNAFFPEIAARWFPVPSEAAPFWEYAPPGG